MMGDKLPSPGTSWPRCTAGWPDGRRTNSPRTSSRENSSFVKRWFFLLMIRFSNRSYIFVAFENQHIMIAFYSLELEPVNWVSPGASSVGLDHAWGEQDARGDALWTPLAQCDAWEQVEKMMMTMHNVYFVRYIFPRNRTSSDLS